MIVRVQESDEGVEACGLTPLQSPVVTGRRNKGQLVEDSYFEVG